MYPIRKSGALGRPRRAAVLRMTGIIAIKIYGNGGSFSKSSAVAGMRRYKSTGL